MSNLRNVARNPLTGGADPAAADEAIYGTASGGLETLGGRVVARPTAIDKIWADARQPRRAVPVSVRGNWTGDPASVAGLLATWQAQADAAAGTSVNTLEIVMGKGEGLEADGWPALAQEWVALARLAASIRVEGLINPISVVAVGKRMLIESGERRWLAYHLLNALLGKYEQIAAIRVDGTDYVWRQARENTARRQLTAIGMARQFALLLMAAREEMGQGTYLAFEEGAQGGCDRWFYAQVSDGNVHRIPKGWAERIESTMGLGKVQLSQYRDLLALTGDNAVDDALWTRADLENWSENALREARRLTTVNLQKIISRDVWGLDDLRPERPAAVQPPPGPALTLPAARPGVPYQPAEQEVIAAGMAVRIKATGAVGRVEEAREVHLEKGYVVFNAATGLSNWYQADAVQSLGMRWIDYAAPERPESPRPEARQTAAEREAAREAAREAVADKARATLAANGWASDKGDSAAPAPRRIYTGSDWILLQGLWMLAKEMGQAPTAAILNQLSLLTDNQAATYAQDGTLSQWAESISVAFSGWYDRLQEILGRAAAASEQYEE